MSDQMPHVLVVEDDRDLRNAYIMILQSQGYQVSGAADGFEGLMALKRDPPNLILLDYFMPNMDGKVFLQNFDSDQYPDVKIVLASNVSDEGVINELLSLGAHRSVLKADLSPNELLHLVKEMTQ